MTQLAFTARGQVTRDRTIAATRSLIRERGVSGTSLSDIEEAAGVGRSQIYHYFDGREGLLRDVVSQTGEKVIARATEILEQAESLAGIELWLDAAIEANERTNGMDGCPVGSLVGELVERDELTRLAFVDVYARWEAPLIAALNRLRVTGVLTSATDTRDLADTVMATMQGGLILSQVRRAPNQLRLALAAARLALRAAAL